MTIPDVAGHAAASASLAALLYWAARARRPRPNPWVTAWLGATAFSGLTELLQMAVPMRAAELRDFLAGMAGTTVALIALHLVKVALERGSRAAGGTSSFPARRAYSTSTGTSPT